MLRVMRVLQDRALNLLPFKRTPNDENSPTTSERLTKVIGPYEMVLYQIQNLIIWENPIMSTIFVIATNIFFWLLSTTQCRFYSIASLTILIVFVYHLWVEEIWPEIRVPPKSPPDTENWTPIHPSVLSVPEISQKLSSTQTAISRMIQRACLLRQQEPAMFCAVCCGCLSVLWVVGRTISGTWLLYWSLMLLLLLPGVWLRIFSPETRAKVKHYQQHVTHWLQATHKTEPREVDLLPEESPETLALLSLSHSESQRRHQENPGTEEELLESLVPTPDLLDENGGDSTLSSLAPVLGIMPSHDEESVDGIELPIELEGIHFKPRHFNGSSHGGSEGSSDSEEGLAKGLTFSDSSSVAPEATLSSAPLTHLLSQQALQSVAQTMAQSVAQSMAATLSSAMGSLQPSSSAQQLLPHGESEEEEEDFEIINSEDVS